MLPKSDSRLFTLTWRKSPAHTSLRLASDARKWRIWEGSVCQASVNGVFFYFYIYSSYASLGSISFSRIVEEDGGSLHHHHHHQPSHVHKWSRVFLSSHCILICTLDRHHHTRHQSLFMICFPFTTPPFYTRIRHLRVVTKSYTRLPSFQCKRNKTL